MGLSLYGFDFFLCAKVENIDEIEKCFTDYFRFGRNN